MSTPKQADKIIIQSGTMSGFVSGIGIAAILTWFDLIGFSAGSPMYGKRETRDKTIVVKFCGSFDANYFERK